MVRRHRRLLLGLQQHQGPGVRLETVASVDGRPANMVFQPVRPRQRLAEAVRASTRARSTPTSASWRSRRRRWPRFHRSTPSSPRRDLAKELKTWALFGPPLGRTWEPTDDEKPEISRDPAAGQQSVDDPARRAAGQGQADRPRRGRSAGQGRGGRQQGEEGRPRRRSCAPRTAPRRSRPGTARCCRRATPMSGWRPPSPSMRRSSPWRSR